MFTVKTDFGTYKNCSFYMNKYTFDDSLFLGIVTPEEPLCDVTVCLGDETFTLTDFENIAFVDTNNCPWLVEFLEENDFAKPMGVYKNSGFCTYPLYVFNMEKIEEHLISFR